MAKIVIDEASFDGSSLEIDGDGVVIIDGVVQSGRLHGRVKIQITEGVLQNLNAGGSVECGEVRGDVTSKMSVTCGNVGGNVKSGMSVTCGDVKGYIDAGMSVTHSSRR